MENARTRQSALTWTAARVNYIQLCQTPVPCLYLIRLPQQFTRIVDLGGATGALMVAAAQLYTQAQCTVGAAACLPLGFRVCLLFARQHAADACSASLPARLPARTCMLAAPRECMHGP